MPQDFSKGKPKWYPVYTHSRSEKRAFESLTKKGIEAYLPMQKRLKQWSDRKKWVEEPLIRSYLFVRIDRLQQAEVLMTKGVARFIYFSGQITPMPDRQIADLKLLLASEAEMEVTEEELLAGEKVRIKAGVLKGLAGEIVEVRSQKRLVVRLKSLGCSLLINISPAYLNRF